MSKNNTSRLAKLLAPLAVDEFFCTYFEKKFLYVPSVEENKSFGHLFSLGDLDHCLSRMVNHNSVSVVKSLENKSQNYPLSSNAQNPLDTFYDAFSEGNSLVLNALHRHWDSAMMLVNDLSYDLGFRVNINMYVTPPNATGFSSHWDSHDVLILQLVGRKAWTLYDGGPDLPSLNNRDEFSYEDSNDLSNPSHEILLKPGGLIYLPRGQVHRASTLEETSIHWTLGLHPHTMEDLLHSALKDWAKKKRELRQSLPVGCMKATFEFEMLEQEMRSLLVTAAQEVHFKSSLHNLKSPWDSTRSYGDGHFEQLEMVDQISLETIVEKRYGDHFQLTPGLESCLLQAPGFKFQPPGKTFQSISYMARHDTFRPGEIPGWLSAEENLLLVRHLVRNGFLRIVSL